jgi:hypothetical protein
VTLLSDPWFLLAATVTVTLYGIAKGGFLGVGVAAVPVLSLVVPPQQATAIVLPVILVQDAFTIWVYRGDYSLWNLKVLLPGVCVGAFLAWLFAASMSVGMVRLAVGVIALSFIVTRVAGPWLKQHLPQPGIASGLFWGVAAGFASTIANAGSPAYQVHMLPQRLPTLTFVGTTAYFFAFSNVLKIPAYFALGQLTPSNIGIGVAFIPLAIATNYLGVWLLRRVPEIIFYRIAYVLVVALAVELIREGILELMAP